MLNYIHIGAQEGCDGRYLICQKAFHAMRNLRIWASPKSPLCIAALSWS